VSRGIDLFRDAASAAARLLENGYESERKPEARFRLAFVEALAGSSHVVATAPDPVSKTAELRPLLPEWPSQPKSPLGGFDLAVRVAGDAAESWRYLAEFKWDALWMQLWDAYKLCHASRLPGVEEVFLVAIATERAWWRQNDGAELFGRDAAYSTTSLLLERYRHRWHELLEKSAKSRPLTLPATLGVSRVADVPLDTKYGPSRLRVAAVRPAGGDWLKVDSDGFPIPPEPVLIDWPYPEPGPARNQQPVEASSSGRRRRHRRSQTRH
jgi:hypothetical protein